MFLCNQFSNINDLSRLFTWKQSKVKKNLSAIETRLAWFVMFMSWVGKCISGLAARELNISSWLLPFNQIIHCVYIVKKRSILSRHTYTKGSRSDINQVYLICNVHVLSRQIHLQISNESVQHLFIIGTLKTNNSLFYMVSATLI